MAPKEEKTSAHLSMSIQISFATQKFQELNEKLSLPESAQGEIAVGIRYNMFHSVLWQQKIQLSIEQAVSAHFQAVTQSIPSSVQNHIYGKGPTKSFREEQREKHHHFPLYYALCESWLLLKDMK